MRDTKKNKTLKCINCEKETLANGYYIGEMEKESNYVAVLDMECSVNWLCSDCSVKAQKLAEELIDMFKGKDYIPLSSIIR